jgi:hypothetical protein
MDGDDGSKSALDTTDRDDVLVLGPGQALQHFFCLGRGQATHDGILLAIEAEMGLEESVHEADPSWTKWTVIEESFRAAVLRRRR